MLYIGVAFFDVSMLRRSLMYVILYTGSTYETIEKSQTQQWYPHIIWRWIFSKLKHHTKFFFEDWGSGPTSHCVSHWIVVNCYKFAITYSRRYNCPVAFVLMTMSFFQKKNKYYTYQLSAYVRKQTHVVFLAAVR